MGTFFRKCFACWMTCAFAFCWVAPVAAQEISLVSAEGRLEIKGRLLHFDGADYRIQTEFGALTVRGEGMTCTGWECPKLDQLVEQFAFVGRGELVTDLMPLLIQTYALASDQMAMGNPHGDTRLTMHIQDKDLDAVALVGLSDTSTSVDTINPIYLGDAPDAPIEEFRSTLLARGALLPISHPDNPIKHLTIAQLTQILDGEIINWSDLGGPNLPISVYVSRDLVSHNYQIPKILGPNDLSFALRMDKDADVERLVATRQGAIGLIRYRHHTDSHIMTIRTQCNWEFRPTRFNIQSAEYPLSFAYEMYLPRTRMTKVQRRFMNWLKSEPAQKAMAKQGFVGVWPSSQRIADQGNRLRHAIEGLGNGGSVGELKKMMSMLGDGQRLSTTFRYNATGDSLDATSLGYASMLSQAISDGHFADKTLFFVGFTDNRQGNGAAVSAGLKRAKLVMEHVFDTPYLEEVDEAVAQPVSFGNVAPVSCNSSPQERAMNWRVELWVKDREPSK